MFLCPACEVYHSFNSSWKFDGDFENPTVMPSLLVTGGADANYRCHSFITEGKIKFLDDCSHSMKNQLVDLPELK